MKNYKEIREKLREIKPRLSERYKVKDIGIFGSYVRGEQDEDSDLDILVTFEGTISLMDMVRLENNLSEELGVEVDLVTRSSLKPRIGERVSKEVVYA